MTYDIVTIGDCMKDTFIFPSLEEMEKTLDGNKVQAKEKYEEYLVFGLGDKISISDVSYSLGGSATNVAAAFSKANFKATLVSAIGGDLVGDELKKMLAERKINHEFLKIYKSRKSAFSIIVSYKSERTIFVYHAFSPENFSLPDNVEAGWIYLGPMANGYERLFNQIVHLMVKQEIKVAVNPGSAQLSAGLHCYGGLLKLIHVIFLNKQEAQTLSGLPGVPQVKDMAKVIQLQGPQVVVITDGINGAYAYNGIDFLKVGIYPGHRVDATGAGDAFASGFLLGMMENESMLSCLKWGVVNAASVVEKIGAEEGLLSKAAIQKRARDYHWPAESLRFS